MARARLDRKKEDIQEHTEETRLSCEPEWDGTLCTDNTTDLLQVSKTT